VVVAEVVLVEAIMLAEVTEAGGVVVGEVDREDVAEADHEWLSRFGQWESSSHTKHQQRE